METLSDLEAAALGCVHHYQPCTAHFIRTRFRASPSPRFSDSAGSVYPMMQRLQKRRLVSSRERAEGRRRVRFYACTKKGRSALRAWIGPPLDDPVAITIDPLRTRMIYFDLLPAADRAAWLDQAERIVRRQLERIDAFEQEHAECRDAWHETFLALANENARLETHARLEWLRLARRRLRAAGLLDER